MKDRPCPANLPPGLSERRAAGPQGRPRRHHIIKQEKPPLLPLPGRPGPECPFKVLPPFRGTEPGLGRGAADAAEGREHNETAPPGKIIRQECGLVVAAPPPAAPAERDRTEGRGGFGQGQGGSQQAGQGAGNPALVPELEPVDERYPAGPEGQERDRLRLPRGAPTAERARTGHTRPAARQANGPGTDLPREQCPALFTQLPGIPGAGVPPAQRTAPGQEHPQTADKVLHKKRQIY